jgi:hypothetical protein
MVDLDIELPFFEHDITQWRDATGLSRFTSRTNAERAASMRCAVSRQDRIQRCVHDLPQGTRAQPVDTWVPRQGSNAPFPARLLTSGIRFRRLFRLSTALGLSLIPGRRPRLRARRKERLARPTSSRKAHARSAWLGRSSLGAARTRPERGSVAPTGKTPRTYKICR